MRTDDTIPLSARQLFGAGLLCCLAWWTAAPLPHPCPCRHLPGQYELTWGGTHGTLTLFRGGACRTTLYGSTWDGAWSAADGSLWCDEVIDGDESHWLTQYPLWGDGARGEYAARAWLARDGAPLIQSEWFTLRRVRQ